MFFIFYNLVIDLFAVAWYGAGRAREAQRLWPEARVFVLWLARAARPQPERRLRGVGDL